MCFHSFNLVFVKKNTFSDIQLVFNITDGQAWLNGDSRNCRYSKSSSCDAYILIKIPYRIGINKKSNYDVVYLSKVQKNTSHPIFNEIYQTGWISRDTIIEVSMYDAIEKNYLPEARMATWKGNAEYYLTRNLLSDDKADGNHRNSLSVSTKIIKKAEGTFCNIYKSF